MYDGVIVSRFIGIRGYMLSKVIVIGFYGQIDHRGLSN